jgi:hypothetical protein
MDTEENQEQVSLSAHRPWKSRCDFHIPTAATKPWKSGKPEAGFPLSHSPDFPLLINFKKEAWRRSFGPSPGSLFDWNMLATELGHLKCHQEGLGWVK